MKVGWMILPGAPTNSSQLGDEDIAQQREQQQQRRRRQERGGPFQPSRSPVAGSRVPGALAPAPRGPPAPGQPAAHQGPEDAERPQRTPPAPGIPAAPLLHARQPHRAGCQEEPAGAPGADLLADRQAGPAARLQAERLGRCRRPARRGEGLGRPRRLGRPQAAGRGRRRGQVQLQALLQRRRRRRPAQGGRRRRGPAEPGERGEERLPRAERRLPAVPPARGGRALLLLRRGLLLVRGLLAGRLAGRLPSAGGVQRARGEEGAGGAGQGRRRRRRGRRGERPGGRGARRGLFRAQVGAAGPAALRPRGPGVALQAGPLRLPPAPLQHRLPRLHRRGLRRLSVPVRAQPGSYQGRPGERPAAGGLGPAGEAAQLQPADRGLAPFLHARIMPRPLLPELPQRLPPGHQQLLQLRPRPGQPEKRIPFGVPHPPAPHHPLLHAQPARAPALHLRLHAPERRPAPHMQLGVGQRTLRQEVCHLRGTPGPFTDPHHSAWGGKTSGWLPYLRAEFCGVLPPPSPAHRPGKPKLLARIPVFEKSTHFGTKQIPSLRQEPFAHGWGTAGALLAGGWTLLFSVCPVWPKTNFSLRTWISVTKAHPPAPSCDLSCPGLCIY